MDSEEELKAMRKLEKKAKKEKKEKKQSKREIEVEAEPADASDAAETPAKKRKRETLPDELEIDVNLPEPASKKAARKAKKAKLNPAPAPESNDATAAAATTSTTTKEDTAKRSEYGVWIGNLPWSATKDTLRQFLIDNAEMKPEQITRIHLPPPTKPVNPAWTTKPLNKGFAYVDFTTELGMYSAIALTETKMDGRALLIKNAKSFEGRPDKPKTSEDTGDGAVKAGGNPPNKRVFVGNLSFDVTKEDLSAHFSQCGAVEHIHMATFEDSGKCKGYAWITFGDVEAATSAVKGFIWKNEAEFKSKKKAAADDEGEAGPTAEGKKRKWLLNKLAGRDLRAEFAEDSTTRYNKRYGKEKPEQQHDAVEGVNPARWKNFSKDGDDRGGRGGRGDRGGRGGGRGGRGGARGGRGGFEGKVDPRSIKSGAAHSNAQRASQAIVQAEGKKTTFE